MQIVKYMKIDVIRSKKLSWALLFPVLAVFILVRDEDTSSLFAYLYCLFAGIILASFPFSNECAAESGFLRMLPGKEGDCIRGHFLYSLLALLLCGVLAIAAIAVAHIIHPAVTFDHIFMYPLMIGIALIFAGLEDTLLCLFHFDNQQALQLIRIAPGFLFFFGGLLTAEKLPGLVIRFTEWITLSKSLTIFIICLVLFLADGQLCAVISSRRDEI